jgi:hypothetical protein
LPNVTEIASDMFGSCAIERIVIPDSVESIYEHSFSFCTNIRVVEFRATSELRQICGFNDCGLERIEFPPQLEGIGDACFMNCKLLREVSFMAEIPRLRHIGRMGFQSSAIKSFPMTELVLSIGELAFDKCPFLAELAVPEDSEVYGRRVFCRGKSRAKTFIMYTEHYLARHRCVAILRCQSIDREEDTD